MNRLRLLTLLLLILVSAMTACAPYNHSHPAQPMPSGPPVGTIVPYWGNVTEIPEGWRICDGEPVADPPVAHERAAIARTP